ncbi:MAG: hypothetical protein Q8R81_06860 [Novosphingobium sp.]|uniref:hypothetical protein n=1 Tax=Novosphingobium sp. TaxID=1874826 RepID=UPI0027345361|nr:hypothetical protein [Novosphingobium sp.]MDP3550098.1 hypothetical protein [Novosphingobium sp.]
MELPPIRPDEPQWLQAKRRRISEERAWNYGGWAAMALFPVPYALMQTLLQNATGALLATASLLTVTAIVVLRRSEKETFQRGFSIWSVPVHGLAVLVFLAKMFQ